MEQRLATAADDLAEPQHGIELLLFNALLLVGGTGVLLHLAQGDHVLQAIGHPGIGGQPIAPGAAGFLVVGFDAFGQIEVCHKAHVGFVDAHAKSDGGDDHHAVFAQKAGLVLLALLGGQPGVVGQRGQPLACQPSGGLLHLAPREAVDDARFAVVVFADETQQLLFGIALIFRDMVANIGAVETVVVERGFLKLQVLHDVVPGRHVGGGGERDARHVGKTLVQVGELAILGAEIVPPLGNAVSFINGEQRNVGLLQQHLHARRG